VQKTSCQLTAFSHQLETELGRKRVSLGPPELGREERKRWQLGADEKPM